MRPNNWRGAFALFLCLVAVAWTAPPVMHGTLFGTTSGTAADGSNTIVVNNGNGITGGATITIGSTTSNITPAVNADTTNEFSFSSGVLNLAYGSAAGKPAEGSNTIGLRNAASSFSFGSTVAVGASASLIDITPTFSTADKAFAEGDNTVGLRNAASSFTFGTPATIGAATSLVDITPTFSNVANSFAQGSNKITLTAGTNLTGGGVVTIGDAASTVTFNASSSGVGVISGLTTVTGATTLTFLASGTSAVTATNSSGTVSITVTGGDHNHNSTGAQGGASLSPTQFKAPPTGSAASSAGELRFNEGTGDFEYHNGSSLNTWATRIGSTHGGSSTAVSRDDHAHATATPVSVDLAANSEGVATTLAKSDHKHDLSEAITPTWSNQHIFAGGGTANSPIRITPSVPPTSPVAGDVWVDSVQGTLGAYGVGSKIFFSAAHFTQTADVNIVNTVTETTLVGSGTGTATLPIGFLVAGKTIRVECEGYYSTKGATAGTLRLRTRLGGIAGTVVGDTAAQTLTDNLTNRFWRAVTKITCRTTGAGGTVMAQGEALLHTSAILEAPWEMVNTGTQSINTLAAQAVTFSAEFGTADTSNSITQTNMAIEVIN